MHAPIFQEVCRHYSYLKYIYNYIYSLFFCVIYTMSNYKYSNPYTKELYPIDTRFVKTEDAHEKTTIYNNLFLNDTLEATGNTKNLVLDATTNEVMYTDGTATYEAGKLIIDHTAIYETDNAIELKGNDGNIRNYVAIDANIKLEQSLPYQGAFMNVGFDAKNSTSGDIYAMNLTRDATNLSNITALNVGANIAPLNQKVGSFNGISTGYILGVDHTADLNNINIVNSIFLNNVDYIIIGTSSKFDQVYFDLSSPASESCEIQVGYWCNLGWCVDKGVIDSTNGFKHSGCLTIVPQVNWIPNPSYNNDYVIVIYRRAIVLTNEPNLRQIKLVNSINFYWDETGQILCSTLSVQSIGDTTNTKTKQLYYDTTSKLVSYQEENQSLLKSYNAHFNQLQLTTLDLASSTEDSVLVWNATTKYVMYRPINTNDDIIHISMNTTPIAIPVTQNVKYTLTNVLIPSYNIDVSNSKNFTSDNATGQIDYIGIGPYRAHMTVSCSVQTTGTDTILLDLAHSIRPEPTYIYNSMGYNYATTQGIYHANLSMTCYIDVDTDSYFALRIMNINSSTPITITNLKAVMIR